MDMPTSSYGSAADLPSVVELDRRLEESKAFAESVLVHDTVRWQLLKALLPLHIPVTLIADGDCRECRDNPL